MDRKSRNFGIRWTPLIAVLLAACTSAVTSNPASIAPGVASDQASIAPDVIYHNAKIITVNENNDIAEAVAIHDGRIIAVGANQEVLGLAAEGTRVVDVQGKTMVPGFYDNHWHLSSELDQEWNGGLITGVQEWIRGADTMEKLSAALRTQVAKIPAGEWIEGSLTREEWPNNKLPTRWQLDEIVPNHPLVLSRGPHTLVLNSKALERVGITRETPDPPGGWILRDERGRANGRVLEAASRLVEPHLPKEEEGSHRNPIEGYKAALEQLLPLGLTSVNVPGIQPRQLTQVQELYERHGEELPRMTAAIRLSPGYDTYDDVEEGARAEIRKLESLGFHTGFGNDRLKLGAVKMSIDGGLSAPVMWTTLPYAGRPGFHGVQRIPDETFYRVAKRAHELGWQLGIHTIGDAAAEMVVKQLDRILEESPREDPRHYLHHVAVKPSEETLQTMAKRNMIVATHPGWIVNLGPYAAEALGPGPRLESQMPTASLAKHGIGISFGSDGLPTGPLFHISTAATRINWEGRVQGLEEKVSVQDALRYQTLGTAYMTFDEDERGSIEVGKLGDLVILGEDILSVDPKKIRDIPVEATIIGGREVYRAGR